MSQFYFAWAGGAPIPAVSLLTRGDVWGGKWETFGSVWGGSLSTTGDIPINGAWLLGNTTVENLTRIDGLNAGEVYRVTGPAFFPVPANNSIVPHIYLTYLGDYQGSLNQAVAPGERVAMILSTDSGFGLTATNGAQLYDASPLVEDVTYRISGSGIQELTTFTYEGSGGITLNPDISAPFPANIILSEPATATGMNIALTIELETGRNIIQNLASTDGLIVGQDYQIFGRGIAAGTIATFQSDGTLLLSQDATITSVQTPLQIYCNTVYPNPGAWNSSYARNDETVLSVLIEHKEGEFPLLTINLKNPQIGLLAPGRNVWCWLSWQDDGTDIVQPLFQGRLVGIPADIDREVVALQFIARPIDYLNQQYALMSGMMIAPFYDPIWLPNGYVDPTTILEANTLLWHIDRLSLEVTTSDKTIGEDGTLAIDESQHVYDRMTVKYGNPPLSAVYMTGTVTWQQQGTGEVDLTKTVQDAFGVEVTCFQGGGLQLGDVNPTAGLYASWPKPGTNIGAGWSVGKDSYIVDTTPLRQPQAVLTGTGPGGVLTGNGLVTGLLGDLRLIDPGNLQPQAYVWTQNYYSINFTAAYDANRARTEVVSFFLEGDIQQLVTDSRSSVETHSLSSSIINQPIDPGGAVPLFDMRSNTYFKTARGQQSIEFLLAYARARLIARARAVEVEVTTEWATGLGLSCRWNAQVDDYRLPGGTASGKVIGYRLIASAAEGMRAIVTIGCTIGHGGTQTAVPGVGTYVQDGYVSDGYQAVSGGTVDIGDGSIIYENFDDFDIDDDGVNLFSMSPATVVKRCTVYGDIDQQRIAIADGANPTAITPGIIGPGGILAGIHIGFLSSNLSAPAAMPDPAAALANCYPVVTLELQSVAGGDFLSIFPVQVSKLSITKTIDMESASDA